MLPIIISDKIISRFQSLLSSALQKNEFNSDENAEIVKKSTDHFKAIARANPLKPKSLPDTGLDVYGALRGVGKSVQNTKAIILENPALLFEHHGISVPGQPNPDEEPEEKPKTRRSRRPSAPSDTPRPDLNIGEIIKAARSVFQKHHLRPDVGKGVIEEGPLTGTKWLSLSTRITNDTNFRMTEGLKSLSQIFDIGMVGLKHKPIDPRKARDAFEDAFNRAADNLGKRYTVSLKAREKDDSPKRRLPFVFQLLEDSIIESSAKTGVQLKDSAVIDKGPLAGMKIKVDDLDGLFIGARNRSADFPFNNYSDFISERQILKKVSEKMQQMAFEKK